jgi:hypothetical protein
MEDVVQELLDFVASFHDDVGQATFESLMERPVVTNTLHLWNDFSLSDVKDALDDMNALNQHYVYRHLFRL